MNDLFFILLGFVLSVSIVAYVVYAIYYLVLEQVIIHKVFTPLPPEKSAINKNDE
ncbi:MAG: hypothetical protein IJ187_02975 [Neisseriaceae bacterium]|nr:hypothetical protein [Neisseriaceae bacterium]MBQ9258802.1 hypothetical protein [Neisseriaceae bacterium]MBR1819373.1 hypothetical protein [Neisseriaceae bacterium]